MQDLKEKNNSMNQNEHMIIYKNNFWRKLKNIIKNIFAKNEIQDNKEEAKKINDNTQKKSKQEILEIYNNVKLGQIELEELDDDDLYKVMILLKEELEITHSKLKEELKKIDIQLYNLKTYNKEIELLKKNS